MTKQRYKVLTTLSCRTDKVIDTQTQTVVFQSFDNYDCHKKADELNRQNEVII